MKDEQEGDDGRQQSGEAGKSGTHLFATLLPVSRGACEHTATLKRALVISLFSSPLWIPEYISNPSGSSNSMNGCSLVFLALHL